MLLCQLYTGFRVGGGDYFQSDLRVETGSSCYGSNTASHKRAIMLWLLLCSQQIYITSKLVINVPVLSWQDQLVYQSYNHIKLRINGSVSLLIGGTIRN